MTRDTSLICQRVKIDETGCFAVVYRPDSTTVCVTAEHTYQDADGNWRPKTAAGIYDCQRGEHELLHSDGTIEKIETFEVLGVEGHSGILFTHVGNRPQVDSKGCFLAGRKFSPIEDVPGVAASRLAYADYMQDRVGIDLFKLIVKDPK